MTSTQRKELAEAKLLYTEKLRQIRQATAKSLFFENEEEKKKRIARLLKPENYNEFFMYYFGYDSPMSLADCDCADFHVKAYKELVENSFITQFRQWFRGSAKSTHSNVGNAFALKQLGEAKFTVIIGANELRANLLLADLQIHLEGNERIIRDFGPQISHGDWSKGMFETTDGCYFMALGIDQPFRGLRRFANRIDLAIVDDVEDRQVANNPRRVRERSEKILSDLRGAFGKYKRRLIIANNYITNTGILRYLHDKLDDKSTTRTSQINIVDKKGNPTWHQRYTRKEVEFMQNEEFDSYTWSREFLNTPIEEGKVFKATQIHYDSVPKLSLMESIIFYGDLSYKDNGDFKAMIAVGKIGRKFYVIDAFVKQSSRSECAKWLYDVYLERKLADLPVTYYIEGLFAMDEFTNDFDMEGDSRGFYVPVLPDKKNTADKYSRIESMLGFFEKGWVYFNDKMKNSSDFKHLISQLLAFEKGSTAPDDAPDALQSAISRLNVSTRQDDFDNIRTTSVDDYKSKNSTHRF
jgi:predicted phage terminase large subunit-like protein